MLRKLTWGKTWVIIVIAFVPTVVEFIFAIESDSRPKQELRQKVWNEAIKDVAKVSHERAVIRRLEKLLAA